MSRASASTSMARNAAAVSVEKYGLPVPPAKMTTRPSLAGAPPPPRVRGEVRAAGAAGEDDHPPLLQVADGPAADEGLGPLPHLHRGEDAGDETLRLHHVLQGQGVDHGGQHAHVVAGDLVDTDASAEVVAAGEGAPAGDAGHLDARRGDILNLLGDQPQHRRVQRVGTAAGQRFPAELEEDAPVARRLRGHRSGRCYSPTLNRAKRRTWIFSPTLATVSVIRSCTVRPASRM